MKKFLLDMVTSLQGGVSSKIIIGSLTYVLIVVSLIVCIFVKPEFPGLDDLISVCLITSSSLLGLTTVENVSKNVKLKNDKE